MKASRSSAAAPRSTTASSSAGFVAPTATAGGAGGWFAGHEVFGPVVSLYEAADFDDAVRPNNEVRYGLSAGIFTSDLGHAMRFVHEADSGMVHVNRATTGAEPHLPFGGGRMSSAGILAQ